MQTSPGISPGSSPTHLERRLAQLEKEHTIREQAISSLLEDLEDLTDTVHHQNKLLASKDAELAAIARDKQKIAEMKKDIEEMEVVLRKEEVWYCLRKLAEEMDAVDKRSDEDYELRMRIQNYVETAINAITKEIPSRYRSTRAAEKYSITAEIFNTMVIAFRYITEKESLPGYDVQIIYDDDQQTADPAQAAAENVTTQQQRPK